MKLSIPDTLTFNGGYVDTAGYLALQGLFTAHVTGNFVTLGATLVHGSSGAEAKLLALPVFCVMIAAVRVFSRRMLPGGNGALNALVGLKIALFAAAAALTLALGPFADSDAPAALATGMLLVAGMAIQNAVHRIFFGKFPPTTLMTGSTTQIMMDLADLAFGNLTPEARAAARTRCNGLLRSVCVFALGSAIAALIYTWRETAVFILPPLVAAVALLLPHGEPGTPAPAAARGP